MMSNKQINKFAVLALLFIHSLIASAANPVAIQDIYPLEGAPPVTVGNALVITEIDVLANDTDADGDPLTVLFFDDPVNGTLSQELVAYVDPETGIERMIRQATYTPAVVGIGQLTYTLSDAGRDNSNYDTMDWGVVTITISDGGEAPAPPAEEPAPPGGTLEPTVEGEVFSVAVNQALETSESILLSNDTPNNGQALFIEFLDDWEGGTASFDLDTRAITFTPNTGFAGTGTFTYTVYDGIDRNWGRVNIIVDGSSPTPPEEPPTPPEVTVEPTVVDEVFSVAVNQPLVISESILLFNDTPNNGQALFIEFLDDWEGGTASFDLDTRAITFTPNTGFAGTGTFTYTVSDGIDRNWGRVNIIVDGSSPTPPEEPPTPPEVTVEPTVVDEVFYVAVNQALETSESILLSNDTPNNGPALFIEFLDDWEGGTASFDLDTRAITFIPNTGFIGTGTFTYTVYDGIDRNWGRVNIIVDGSSPTPPEEPPTPPEVTVEPTVVDEVFSVAVNQPLVISESILLSNDTPNNGQALFIEFLDDWEGGTASFDLDTRAITFTPNTGFAGTGTFTYTVSDGIDRNWGRVNIIVDGSSPTPPEEPPTPPEVTVEPTVVDEVFYVAVNQTLETSESILLSNDTPNNGQALFIEFLDDLEGGIADFNRLTGAITFTPNVGFIGTGTFTYTVSDGIDRNWGRVNIVIEDPVTPDPEDNAFATPGSANRFFAQATFGAKKSDIEIFTGQSASTWFQAEITKQPSFVLPIIDVFRSGPQDGLLAFRNDISYRFAFLKNAIGGDDQLRQRMALALSEILVTSDKETFLSNHPRALGYYQDLLIDHAFGNYRELLEVVTYSPAMGAYLTYAGNQKADPVSGRTPDENYAREILQLFSIGVIELEQNGDPVLDENDAPIEVYSNNDIKGLARVFTGIYYATPGFNYPVSPDVEVQPMVVFPEFHSNLEKTFLGQRIPANTGGEESIDIALDALVNHPNTAPFIGRQLIQRFVTSHPSSDYIERVAQAFALGRYVLPDGNAVGDGRRGDLAATIASVLFDRDARAISMRDDIRFGKIREPIIRFTHWARAFDAQNITPEFSLALINTDALGQQAYGSPSVFNFFRPGYVAPGTETGDQGITSPELQITNSSSIPGYVNFMEFLTSQVLQDQGANEVATQEQVRSTLRANYEQELALADNPESLIDSLDNLLTYGFMSSETKDNIITAIETIPLVDNASRERRVFMAVLMVMTSPDYIVQR